MVHDFVNSFGNEPAFEHDFFHILQLIRRISFFDACLVDEFDGNGAAGIAVGPWLFVAAGVEGFGITVVQFQGIPGHDLPENEIDGRQDGGIASEIAVQVDAMGGTVFVRGKMKVLIHENGGVRLPEAVDALLEVAHHEPILSVGYEGGNQLLDPIGILVFVDHDFLVFPADRKGRFRREEGCLLRREVRVLPVHQDVQGIVLHIVEVHEAFLLFPLFQGFCKVQGQAGKDGDHRQHGGGFRNPLGLRYLGKRGNFFCPGIFCTLAEVADGHGIGGIRKVAGFSVMESSGLFGLHGAHSGK